MIFPPLPFQPPVRQPHAAIDQVAKSAPSAELASWWLPKGVSRSAYFDVYIEAAKDKAGDRSWIESGQLTVGPSTFSLKLLTADVCATITFWNGIKKTEMHGSVSVSATSRTNFNSAIRQVMNEWIIPRSSLITEDRSNFGKTEVHHEKSELLTRIRVTNSSDTILYAADAESHKPKYIRFISANGDSMICEFASHRSVKPFTGPLAGVCFSLDEKRTAAVSNILKANGIPSFNDYDRGSTVVVSMRDRGLVLELLRDAMSKKSITGVRLIEP